MSEALLDPPLDGEVRDVEGAAIAPEEILCVRRGPGANCSSIGSAIDVLFATAAVAGAILVAVSAALAEKAPKREAPRRREEDPGDAGAS